VVVSRRLLLLTFLALLVRPAVGCAAAPDPLSPERRVLAADYSMKRIAIVNGRGEVEWEHKIDSLHDLHHLPTGNVLFQTNMQRLVEVDPKTGKVVWEYDAGRMNGNEGKKVEVHAFQRLPGGLTMIAESGPARIIEVDAAGKIQKQIKLKVSKPDPHRDTRLARKLDNGHYLVAHEGDGAVREYDADGTVVWEYEVPLFGKPRKGGHGPEAFGNAVFSALRLPSGNTLIGTGNGHSVLEVTPDKKIVWEVHQDDLKNVRLAWVTTLEVHPNGNVVIGNCHAGADNPQLVEVTWDKQVVWTFKDLKHFGDSMSNSQVLGVTGPVIR
jgi:outer membrane protein assembly factor BamB